MTRPETARWSKREHRPTMAPPRSASPIKRLETWLWTGPVGHFAGGALDFAHALARYLLARALGRTIR
jgi:hypothetical protein